ncbi:hypothetical protein BU23DRAFT_555982 [Bimuria novae-zelandiae CBS 107.79]|uniref:Uncharacterized protein n=1 Tax=Bimuria novae-zelandiae CBS 107.79 TaxID=1447943 RepID=A0A6A5V345_9PLEO|nr:hypothetical protein BU23DRAFT_555982 [Bimuria novae-zelandiae CBS 107.79]
MRRSNRHSRCSVEWAYNEGLVQICVGDSRSATHCVNSVLACSDIVFPFPSFLKKKKNKNKERRETVSARCRDYRDSTSCRSIVAMPAMCSSASNQRRCGAGGIEAPTSFADQIRAAAGQLRCSCRVGGAGVGVTQAEGHLPDTGGRVVADAVLGGSVEGSERRGEK